MKRKKKYIEFTGPHTAGKTSIIHEIVDNDLLKPLSVIYPQKIKRSSILFALALPWVAICNFRHLLFLKFFWLRYVKLNFINYHSVGRHLFKMILLHPYYERYDFDVWLKDDMLHLLPRIDFRKGVDVDTVLRKFFMHFAYLYDGIVYVDIPETVMKERFDSRFEGRSSWRIKSRIPVYKRSYVQGQVLKNILVGQKCVPVLCINGTDEIQKNAHHVEDFIKKEIL